jgi:nucleoside-diphosphate-sugar epimerase
MCNDQHKKTIGLVGANGFIGSAILRALLHRGIIPQALCGPIGSPQPLPADVQFVTCDLADADRLESWVAGLEVVIHAAGPPSVQRSFERAEEYVRVHVEGTAALLRACRIAKIKRVVYISSAEVYGRPEINPVAESHRLQARSPYAAAKIGAEKMIEAHVESFGLRAVILRPFSIYGPHFHSDSLLSRVVSTAKSGCIRVRDLRPVRDYCYVGDLAAAVLQACYIPEEKLQIVNVGSGVGTSVADLAGLVLRSLGLSTPIVEERLDLRPGQSEIFELVADITTAQNVLGWLPTVSLLEGLRLTLSVETGKK